MTAPFIPKTIRHTVLAALTAAACIGSASASNSLQVTAIVGKNMKSTLECWTLAPDYMDVCGVRSSCRRSLSSVRGETDHEVYRQMKIQQMGNLAKATYTEMPADKDFEQG